MTCILLYLLSSFLINHIVCQTNRPYKNLYGTRSFRNGLQNLMAGISSLPEVLVEGERFVKSEPPDKTPRDGDQYDFIVVGAGTAGATLAARLTEIPSVSVLLIEAGPSENLFMDIPIFVTGLQYSDLVNWKYSTEPSNNYCRGFVDRRCKWPRGKVMGGSSVLNYMVAMRGHPRDYDRWAELGNKGWSWPDVLPYFKKLETMDSPGPRNGKVRGYKGPVHLEHPPFHTPLAEAFLKAGVELGYNVSDYNGLEYTGFSYPETTIKNGMRMSSNVAYLHPARDRRNLFVTKNSLASKLLFDKNASRAIGVEFIKVNRRLRVYVTKEVILTAGTIGSAQLLMLSGIGPAQHLKQFNIEPIVNAPVGRNLMDHIACGALIFRVDQPVAINLISLLHPANPYLRDFSIQRKGPMAIPGSVEALAFIDVDSPPNGTNTYPNVELLFTAGTFVSTFIVRETFGIKPEVWDRTYAKIDGADTWAVFPMLLRPKSRGKILLRSDDIQSKPRIYANYMSDKEDVRILVAGIRATLRIAKTKAMQRFGTKLHPTPLAGCESFPADSDEYWECAVRTITLNIYHYSGTCKMGPKGDKTAVVDSRLKVYGVDGLRVGDASIMPEIPSGHTNIPVFMIAEKLADMIKEDWGYPIDVNDWR